MKSTLQRIQDHAFNAVDPTSKTDAQDTETILVKYPRGQHLHRKNYNRIDNSQKFHESRKTNSMFPMGTLSFQASQQNQVW